MKIDALSFCGVYRTTNKQFSPTQYKISQEIKERLTSQDYVDKRGYTPDEKLKKQGYDTILSPADNDCVDLSVVTNLKEGIGIQPHSYSENTYVGRYDKNSDFSPKDIHRAINEKSSFGAIFLIPVVGILSLIAANGVKNCTNSETNNTKVINVTAKDSLQNSVKTISADTFKVIKNR